MPLISVVVPVYNTAAYLGAFLESLAFQDGSGDCELVLVDDGSTDGSGAICDAFAEGNPHTVVVHQPNGGVSAARNRGVAMASGRYVWFCDSDDRIVDGALRAIAAILNEKDPDILVFPILQVDENGKEVGEIPAPRRPRDSLDGPLQCGDALYPHAHVFRRTLAEGLEFQTSLALLEDRDFFYRLCLRGVSGTEVHERPMYRYLVTRPDSAVNTPSIEKSLGAVRVERGILLSELARGFPSPAYELYAARALGVLTQLGKEGGYEAEFLALRAELLSLETQSRPLSRKDGILYALVKYVPSFFRCLCRSAHGLQRPVAGHK